VTDPRELLERYLRQRAAMGEGPLILEAPRAAEEPKRARPPAPERAPTPAAARARAAWQRGAPPIPPAGLLIPSPEKDLFSADPLTSMTLSQIGDAVRACTKCVLCRERTHAVPGEGPEDARLVVVGEGPGATEDETGRPFVGRAGKLLDEILAAIELPRERVYICNVVKCRPPQNRKPQQDEMDACVPYLYRQLDLIRPKVILAMGNTAAETLLNTKQSLGSLRGRVHNFRGMPLIVTYHPAALLRNPHWKKPTWDDVRIARQLIDA
jgi:uracil-DNA glycosylase family 4